MRREGGVFGGEKGESETAGGGRKAISSRQGQSDDGFHPLTPHASSPSACSARSTSSCGRGGSCGVSDRHALLCAASRRLGAATAAEQQLQRAASHLAFRLHCRLRLSEVAAKVAFTSAGNLSRLFRLRYGMNFRAYLQKLRLGKAAELLASTRLPVGTIARRVGYRDFSRFGQHFKRMHGMEPSRWRTLRASKRVSNS